MHRSHSRRSRSRSIAAANRLNRKNERIYQFCFCFIKQWAQPALRIRVMNQAPTAALTHWMVPTWVLALNETRVPDAKLRAHVAVLASWQLQRCWCGAG